MPTWLHVVHGWQESSLFCSERPVIRYTAVCGIHTNRLCIIWCASRVPLVDKHICQTRICTRCTAVLSYVWEWCVSSRIVHKHWQQSFILPDQMMRVPHTDTHTGFVLCDQMMRVAMMLVTSIQQCPILFGSHPYCVTVLLMLCKHISSVCISYTALFSMKYGCSDTLYVWEIITY